VRSNSRAYVRLRHFPFAAPLWIVAANGTDVEPIRWFCWFMAAANCIAMWVVR
jgi:hypothetical protein